MKILNLNLCWIPTVWGEWVWSPVPPSWAPVIKTSPEPKTHSLIPLRAFMHAVRPAHVSDFLLGAILQLSSAYRVSRPDCSEPVQTFCSDRKRRAREGEVEQNALWLCARSHARGNKSKWCMIRKCTEEAELFALHATDQSRVRRQTETKGCLVKARLHVCMMGSLQ